MWESNKFEDNSRIKGNKNTFTLSDYEVFLLIFIEKKHRKTRTKKEAIT